MLRHECIADLARETALQPHSECKETKSAAATHRLAETGASDI